MDAARKGTLLGLGTVLTALGASLCCILPVALASMVTLAPAADSSGSNEQGLVTSEFAISGMTCGGCAAGVKITIERLGYEAEQKKTPLPESSSNDSSASGSLNG